MANSANTANTANGADQPLTPEQLKTYNQALEERLAEANKDATKWKKVLPDLMAADVFVVANVAAAPENSSGRFLNILTITDSAGHHVIPFFTSPSKMSVLVTKEKTTFNVMKINTVKLFQSIKGKPAVLNPRSPSAKLFNPFEMNILVMENLDKLPKQAESKENKSEEQA